MEFKYQYAGESAVSQQGGATAVSFAADTLRAPVQFIAEIRQHVAFRETMSALHRVVLADLRFRGRDHTAYLAWLQANESNLLAEFMSQAGVLKQQVAALQDELKALRKQKDAVLSPFLKAQHAYFDHLYQHNREWWYVLDPVITVHPDLVFFECFSQDESTYARLSFDHTFFEAQGETVYGTTNIDYSQALYDEFQRIRPYHPTRLEIAGTGLSVQTAAADQFVEHKIDVPDSWVRGFLQVSSAMAQPGIKLTLDPMDLHNICHLLKRRKERVGPRSIRCELVPGQPVRMVFEPWNTVLECPRSSHSATETQTIRLWGRRRLLQLERLIPLATTVDVLLLGSGMPSFWQVAAPGWEFTLGLSGWTANDWSRCGQFDLLGARQNVDHATCERILQTLAQQFTATVAQLAQQCALDSEVVASGLLLLSQDGRVIYDLSKGAYRLRELSREPLKISQLVSERENTAAALVAAGQVKKIQIEQVESGYSVTAQIKVNGQSYTPYCLIDVDERMTDAGCQCHFYTQNRLYRGPCEHIIATRLAAQRDMVRQKTKSAVSVT
ncbi:SWIM zinc finger family protein [Chitinibacter sp. GC72]|uniref:SWIM zinc finger family protein n=1 Tax=Chitinibacter sp. GC72 TaxID=1526917 RepID=UPI0012F71894|nr:SWIM zinc finger family protein [Chitinibacter sp. GC72]